MKTLTRDDTEHGKEYVLLADAEAEIERRREALKPAASLHVVRVMNGEPGEIDEALSFAEDNFPLSDTGMFRSISV